MDLTTEIIMDACEAADVNQWEKLPEAIARLQARIEELEQANRWISVEERLPEKAGKCDVICDKNGVSGVAYWDASAEFFRDAPIWPVTHWQHRRPLPAPPEGGPQ